MDGCTPSAGEAGERPWRQWSSTTLRWTAGPESANCLQHGGNGTGTINGLLYLPGGKNASGTPTRTLYAYNASANAWSTKAPMPVPSGCGGSGVIGGQLYVFTGCISAVGLHRTAPP